MIHRTKISLFEILFNILFFTVCIVFLFTIFFIFSPFSDSNYFPVLSQYIDKYFWTIYSGPILIALLCFVKKRLFPTSKDRVRQKANLGPHPVGNKPEPVEIYKHEA